jgi:copper chaperone
MTNKIDFTVVGNRKMNCIGCETLLRLMLRRMPGIKEVTADATTQKVAVCFDRSQISSEQVQAKLQEIGFEVEKVAA